MKILENVKKSMKDLRTGFERYPITLIASVVLLVILISLNEMDMKDIDTEILGRIAMVVGLSLPLSISVAHLNEGLLSRKPQFKALAFAFAAALLVAYYFLFTEDHGMVTGMRYAAALVSLIIGVFFTQRLNIRLNYETYVTKVFYAFFLTALYSGVLYFGISAIIFTINSLFDAEIPDKYYLYSFLTVVFVFAASMFLSKLPRIEETFEEHKYTKALKVLLLYIVIPLITIYTGILYVYFIKIIVTGVWPRGLVSNLVLWYSVLSAGVIFFISPLVSDNFVARAFRNFFPIADLPILAMMFVSMGLRIGQYGFTENRYLVVILGIWALVAMVWFIAVRKLNNIFLPISLTLTALIAVFGPFSAFKVSEMSQNSRLESILEINGMVQSGSIVPNASIPDADKREISAIASFFESRETYDMEYVPEGFKIMDMNVVFGFPYDDNRGYLDDQYFYFFVPMENQVLEIKGYEHLVKAVTYQTNEYSAGTVSMKYDSAASELIFSDSTGELLKADFKAYYQKMFDASSTSAGKGEVSVKDATFIEENEKISVKIIFESMNGNHEDGKIKIDNAAYFVLVRVK